MLSMGAAVTNTRFYFADGAVQSRIRKEINELGNFSQEYGFLLVNILKSLAAIVTEFILVRGFVSSSEDPEIRNN